MPALVGQRPRYSPPAIIRNDDGRAVAYFKLRRQGVAQALPYHHIARRDEPGTRRGVGTNLNSSDVHAPIPHLIYKHRLSIDVFDENRLGQEGVGVTSENKIDTACIGRKRLIAIAIRAILKT